MAPAISPASVRVDDATTSWWKPARRERGSDPLRRRRGDLTLECCALFRFRVNAATGGSRFREAAGRSRLWHFRDNPRRAASFDQPAAFCLHEMMTMLGGFHA